MIYFYDLLLLFHIVCVCMHMCACVRVCVYVCVFMYMFTCMYVYHTVCARMFEGVGGSINHTESYILS